MSIYFFNATATASIYTLSLHDALPILMVAPHALDAQERAEHLWRAIDALSEKLRERIDRAQEMLGPFRSEEHTSELQSQSNLVCRLLLEKKNIKERYNDKRTGVRV